ncbi:ankyrin repeat domain-containing protein [Massilia sp. BJB1822]|uniref:ankyrin repeat domain-containing protein n=1 Tax=Massilia sp. BJB1822 TaxID=2744470 RepID=UPI001594B498|nr:ankyrin repeat domain-containing protein [Massilia sp. BJB1822]NVD97122.1 ankyrin repeat domain-containing protein [Massilia sp. BJB1822]
MKNDLIALLQQVSTLPEFAGRELDVNMRAVSGDLPVHAASAWQNKDAIDTLLAHGADINSVGGDGETPLFRVIRQGSEEFFRFLLLRGANVAVQNADGVSPVEVAREVGDSGVVAIMDMLARRRNLA